MYWRYELAVRGLESRLCSITAGNGAIYATRRDAYIVVDPIMGHDLSLPFNMVKRGLRAVYVPGARASEKMVPSLEGEFARKRRMMSHTWPILLRGGMLSPRGYPPGYALMILSHRLLRYCTPRLHVLALAANVALLAIGAGAAVRGHARAADRAAARAPRSPARCARAAAADRPLLRAHARPRSPPACGTGCATGRPRPGTRPREPGDPPDAGRHRRLRARCSRSRAPVLALAMLAIRLESRGTRSSTASAASAWTGGRSTC